MKKIFTFVLVILISFSAFAQKDVITKNATPIWTKQKTVVPHQKNAFIAPDAQSKYAIPFGTPVGLTNYDLQTNGTSTNRMLLFADGQISAAWIQDQSTAPGGDTRGSGYAHYDGSAWKFIETTGNETLEGSTKAGWPSLMTDGTNEMVTSHYRSGGGLFYMSQAIGATGSNWTRADITSGGQPMLWPRSASSGQYQYIVCVGDLVGTTPPDGCYFYRSTDAGSTWSFEGKLPDFDTYYDHAGGDSYVIDAHDSIVAIVYFGGWGDTRLWKSTNYGEDWTQTRIIDFPIDKYTGTDGNLLDMDNNSEADTIISDDGTGDVIIDNNGLVHVVFSRMRVLDEDAGDDGSSSYFPYTDWLLYWNENMGEGTFNAANMTTNNIDMAVSPDVDTIGWFFDLNGNDSTYSELPDAGNDLPFGKYYTSLTSMPTLGVDTNNNIYCAFTTIMDGDAYVKTDAEPNIQTFRGLWLRARDTSGLWRPAVCISDKDGKQAENVFPDMARDVDNKVHLIVQWDNEPGLHIRGDEDAVTDNYILYKEIVVSDTILVNNPSVVANNLNINVYPNPVQNFVTIDNVQGATITIYNMVGELVQTINANENSIKIDLTDYVAGAYIVRAASNKGVATTKILKIK